MRMFTSFFGADHAATVVRLRDDLRLGNYTDQHQLCGIMFRVVSSYGYTTGSAHPWATPASSGNVPVTSVTPQSDLTEPSDL